MKRQFKNRIVAIALAFLSTLYMLPPLSIVGSAETTAKSNVEHLTNASGYGTEFEFLGMGFNALSMNVINKDNLKLRPIINYDTIDALVITGQYTVSTGTGAESATEMMKNLGIDFSTAKNASVPIKIAQIGFESKFSAGLKSDYSEFAKSSFYYYVNETISEKYAMRLYENSKKYLSDEFVFALGKVNSDFTDTPNDMAAAEFFENWGTHMLTAYNKGAYLEFYAHAHTKNTSENFEFGLSYENGASASIGKDISIGTSNEISGEYESKVNTEETEYYSKWEAHGGASEKGATLAKDSEKTQEKIEKWAESINADNKVIIPRTTEWKAVWEILPVEYNSAIKRLQDYYAYAAQNKNLEFFDKFTSYINVSGDTVMYTSPSGYVSKVVYGNDMMIAPGASLSLATPDTNFNEVSYSVEVSNLEHKKYVGVNDYGVLSVSSPKNISLTGTVVTLKTLTLNGKQIDKKSFAIQSEGGGMFAGGYGNADRPYLISNAQQFTRIRNKPHAHYLLVNDIDFASSVVAPIDNFLGVIDGNGYTLKNWSYDQKTNGRHGLFLVNSGTIKNLTINNFRINTVDGAYGELQAGLLCAENKGSVVNVVVSNSYLHVDMGSVDTDFDSGVKAGLLCGISSGKIEKCGVVSSELHAYSGSGRKLGTANCWIGGITGCAVNNAEITDSYSHDNELYATAKGRNSKKGSCGWANAGGVVGRTEHSSVILKRCLGYDNNINVQAEGKAIERNGGSLVGYIFATTVNMSDCYSEPTDHLFGKGTSNGGTKYFGELTTPGAINNLTGFISNGWIQSDNGGHPSIAQDTTFVVENGKREYNTGDELVIGGLDFYVINNDNMKTKTEVSTGLRIIRPDFTSAGNKTVTVCFGKLSTTYDVTVRYPVINGITIQTPPHKTSYFKGEEFDVTGLKVVASKTDGTCETLDYDDFDIDEINTNDKVGDNLPVEVKYTYRDGEEIKEYSDYFTVSVFEILPTSLVIVGYPKQKYAPNEDISYENLKLKVRYNNGEERELSDGEFKIDGSNYDEYKHKPGTYTIKLSYSEKNATCETSYEVVVGSVISIKITKAPSKTTYFTSDTENALDLSGIELTVYYDNGAESIVTDTSKMRIKEMFDRKVDGKQMLTVIYDDESIEGKTADYEINVVAKELASIQIVHIPKKSFFIGESVDESDFKFFVLKANYNDGSYEYVKDGYTVNVENGPIYENGKLYVYDDNGYKIEKSTKFTTVCSPKATVGYKKEVSSDTPFLEKAKTQTDDYFINVLVEEVVDFQVTTMPEKTIYKPGEEFEDDGMKLAMVYNSGNTITLPYKDEEGKVHTYDRCEYDFTESGIKTVVIEYKNRVESFDVLVTPIESITVEALPTKTEYEVGEKLDTTGISIKKHYVATEIADEVDDNDCHFSVTQFDTVGVTYVTVEYGNCETSFPVTVKERDITKLPRIELTENWALQNGEVQAKIYLKNNPGINNVTMNIAYPSNLLEYVGASYEVDTFGGSFSCNTQQNEGSETAGASGSLKLTWSGSEDCSGEQFATITFKVTENALPGEMISLKVVTSSIKNSSKEIIEFTTTDGIIYVIDYIPGDVNGDKKTNAKDATALWKHYSDGIEVDYRAADVDDDGDLDTDDMMLLMQYLAGWNVDVKYQVLYAQYLIFDANGGIVNEKLRMVTAGNTLGELPVPTRENYTFEGWYDGDVEMTAESLMPDSFKVNLVAKWEPNVYTVYLDNDGAETAGTELLYQKYATGFYLDEACEKEPDPFTIPVKKGYSFTGYFLGEKLYIDKDGNIQCNNNTFEDDATLIAKWKKNSTVTLVSEAENPGTVTVYIKATDKKLYSDEYCTQEITRISIPEKKGYTFNGYYTSVDAGETLGVCYIDARGGFVEGFEMLEECELYADWFANKYTVVYDANGGKGATPESEHTYDVERTLSDNGFSRDNYAFGGWNTANDGTGVSYEDGATVKNLTAENGATVKLYAMWKEINYTIVYDANGGNVQIASAEVEFGKPYGALPVPTRDGYTFVSWSYNNQIITSDTIVDVDSEHTLVANWRVIPYAVSWNTPSNATVTVNRTSSPNNPDPAKQNLIEALSSGATVYYGDVLSISYAASEGYTITSNGKKSITVIGNVTSDDIYVFAIESEYVCLVTFDPNGGTVDVLSQKVAYGDKYRKLPIPTRDEYGFCGWYTSTSYTDRIDEDSMVSSKADHTLYAKWVKVSYNWSTLPDHNITLKEKDGVSTVTTAGNMSKSDLIAAGYTRINVSVTFEMWEKDNCFEYLEVLNQTQKYEVTASLTNCLYSHDFDLSDQGIDENCAIAMNFYCDDSDWINDVVYIGAISVTVTAIK